MTELHHRCTNILLAHGSIEENQAGIFIYGFELLFSTIGCITGILLAGVIFGYLKQAVIFLLYFMPIRVAAGGYHAKSYRSCFVLTNFIAIGCVVAANIFCHYQCLKIELILLLGLGIAAAIIWRDAPIIPLKYKGKTNRYKTNRRYAHAILIIEMIILLPVWLLKEYSIVYTAVVTCYMVAIMMKIAKKEES